MYAISPRWLPVINELNSDSRSLETEVVKIEVHKISKKSYILVNPETLDMLNE